MPSQGRIPPTSRLLPRLIRVFAVAIALAVAAPGGAGAAPVNDAPHGLAPSANGVAFGIQPASATQGDGRPNFTYGGSPGAVIHDHVAIVNIAAQPVTLDLYAADATLSGGQFALRLQSDKQRDIGAWITIQGPARITVPARTPKGPSVVIVPFVLHIPVHGSPGDHAGAVLVSLHTAAKSGGNSIGLNQRVGARVYLRVAGPVHPALSVEGLTARYRTNGLWNPLGSGDVAVKYRVRNAGNVILSGTQAVSVSGLFGSVRAATLPAIPQLLPGDYIDVSTTASGVFPQVRLSVKVTLHPIAPVGAVDPGLKDSSKSTGIWAVPWTLLVLIVLVGFGVAEWLRRRNARRKHRGAHKFGPPPRSQLPVPVG